MLFKSVQKKRMQVRRQLTKMLMDCAEDFFVWLFRREHPNPNRRRKSNIDKGPRGGFGGGGATL